MQKPEMSIPGRITDRLLLVQVSDQTSEPAEDGAEDHQCNRIDGEDRAYSDDFGPTVMILARTVFMSWTQ